MGRSEPAPPVHPGEVLKAEFLDEFGISAYALAKDLRVPANRITAIVNGERSITAETAMRLARYFGTTDFFWMNLQTNYDLAVARSREGKRIDKEVMRYRPGAREYEGEPERPHGRRNQDIAGRVVNALRANVQPSRVDALIDGPTGHHMTSAQHLDDLHRRYLSALDVFRDATAVITDHMNAGTSPTDGERQREARAVQALRAAQAEYLAAFPQE